MLTLTETKWRIIKELIKGGKTPTQISRELNLSLPAIHRELANLTNSGFIKKLGKIKGKTRPFSEYSLNEFIYFIKAFDGEAEAKFLPLDKNLRLHLRMWSIPQQEFHSFIDAYWHAIIFSEEVDYEKNIESIAIFGSVARGEARKGSDVDVLIVTKNYAKALEEPLSALIIKVKDQKGEEEKVFVGKLYSKKDFVNSLRKGSKFLKEVIKDMAVLYDPNNFLMGFKNESGKRTS